MDRIDTSFPNNQVKSGNTPEVPETTSPHSIISIISNPSQYRPHGVTNIISQGRFLIGMLNQTTVLKYASDPTDTGYKTSFRVEDAILRIIGPHPHIIESKGLLHEGALMLKFYPRGTLRKYLKMHPHIHIKTRLKWYRQLVETIGFIHSKHVIHCDICLHNVLLDDDLDLILADFQGVFKSLDGTPLLDGLTREAPKSFMPSPDVERADILMDLFALGSAIYHIIVGHEVFPELTILEDEDEIRNRLENGIFPGNNYVASNTVEKCWKQGYEAVGSIIVDLGHIEDIARAIEAERDFELDCRCI